MTHFSEPAEAARPQSPRAHKPAGITSFEAERKRERDVGMAVLSARRKAEERARVRQQMKDLWPVWSGLVVGIFGPAIAFVARALGSWCMKLVFPFVVLAERPEIQVGPITHMLPTLMVYFQFPIEGWLAYLALRQHARPRGVLWQVMLFHFLGLAELWMLSGGLFNFWRR